jgi:hypothetical protein
MTDSSPSSFVPISPNPFIVGNPVRERTMFFGREAEFELVRKRVSESSTGGLLVFCGERRSGKTSILFQILDRRLGPDFIPVLIDMQSMAIANEIDFLGKISNEVLAALGPDAAGVAVPVFGEDSNHSATFRRFVHQVLRALPKKKLILLFDEYELFENKIDAGALGQDVLYILASLMEHESVFVIFTGSQDLSSRRAEYWKILGKSVYKTISYLERNDALSLIVKPVAGRLTYAGDTVDRIWRLAAGQAFYTQAICQSLVDLVNESRTNVATPEALTRVVSGIVDNPLPQMIFLWDGLERDEKLVLSLLAESLADESAWAGAQDLARGIQRREYPLTLSKAQISTALEKLFQTEMLLKSDATDPPRYAFRMDLWRLWIRRMHSVWQVMREEGLEIRQTGLRPRARRRIAGGVLLVVVAAALGFGLPRWFADRRPTLPPPPSSGPSAGLLLEVVPRDAVISANGRRLGVGSLNDAVPAGREQRFSIAAPGYADSEMVVTLKPGETWRGTLTLRPLLGNLSVQTRPAGALITVDGRAAGKSPLVVTGLPVAADHVVEASLAGFGAARTTARPGGPPVSLMLEPGQADVLFITTPAGAEVRLDGTARGKSPVRVSRVAFGRHQVFANREGWVAAESTVIVSAETREIDLSLRTEPPGILVVQGDRPAQIYLNGTLVAENVQNSGARELPPGTHQVRVVLVSGETIDQTVVIRPRERAIYDYSTSVVTRKSQ